MKKPPPNGWARVLLMAGAAAAFVALALAEAFPASTLALAAVIAR